MPSFTTRWPSPVGWGRLVAHRVTGVASYDIRNAERQLEQALGEMLAATASPESAYAHAD